VTLITTDKTNWPLLKGKYGLTCSVDDELFFVPNMLVSPSMMARAVITLSSYLVEVSRLKLIEKHDLLINTSGEVINFMEDIAYINAVPMRVAFNYPASLPITNKWWRCYSRVYDLFLKTVDGLNRHILLLTNSKFLEAIISKSLHRHALVIYPPVDVEKFTPLFKRRNRKNLIVTVSRFRPGKNLELIPKIAKRVVNSKFLIIGPSDKASETTIKNITGLARSLGVQAKVQVLTNEPQSVLHQILSEAKVLLHTQFFEAFGMSVVEAMAAGCVPIVPNIGGPWLDILDQAHGTYGYSYGSLTEAAEKIELLLENEALRRRISARANKRAATFATPLFERTISRVVERVYSKKAR
jgi:alpha-1,2-mannosyltransferase